MDLLQALILAVVQGATEFLPVSSKTHIALTSKLIGVGDVPIDFVVTLHLGTLLAVLVYYRRDLWGIVSSPFRLGRDDGTACQVSRVTCHVREGGEGDGGGAGMPLPRNGNGGGAEVPAEAVGASLRVPPARQGRGSRALDGAHTRDSQEGEERPREHLRLMGLLLVGTIPAAIAGYLLEDKIEGLLNSVTLDGAGLMVTALILVVASKLKGTRGLKETGWRQALLVGCAQACALLPGISRSGSTIVGSLACGMSREWAPRFSFLLSVPVILGGAAVKLKDLLEGGASALFDPVTYLISALVAAVIGYLAIVLVIDSIRRGNLLYFAAYCSLLGVAAVISGALGLA